MFHSDIFNYEGTLIRPPSEAESLIFQITLGCSDNGCIFCPAYKDKPFRIKDSALIKKEFERAAKHFPDARKIFFADGDAMSVPQNMLAAIFDEALKYFPQVSRIGIYGSVKSLRNKSIDDLKELKKRKLGIVYLGFETGDEEVYKLIEKYGTPEGNVETCLKVKDSGIKTNVTVISGLGGKDMSAQHAVNTAKILNQAGPDQVAVLTLMIVKGTKIYGLKKEGRFRELSAFEHLEELYSLVSNLEDFRCQFFANHASNYVPIAARFPKDKPAVLAALETAVKKKDPRALKPDFLRGL